MNDFKAKIRGQAFATRARAANAMARAKAAGEQCRATGEAIPCGQPIQVRHLSEGRRRRDIAIARIDASFEREHEALEAAEWLEA